VEGLSDPSLACNVTAGLGWRLPRKFETRCCHWRSDAQCVMEVAAEDWRGTGHRRRCRSLERSLHSAELASGRHSMLGRHVRRPVGAPLTHACFCRLRRSQLAGSGLTPPFFVQR